MRSPAPSGKLAPPGRPVDLYLTHGHVDHFLNASRFMAALPTSRLYCEASGACAIEDGDAELTQANLFAWRLILPLAFDC